MLKATPNYSSETHVQNGLGTPAEVAVKGGSSFRAR